MTAGFTPAPKTVSKVCAAEVTQYNGVVLDSAGKIVPNSATADITFGIAQEDGVTNDVVSVAPVNGGGSSYVELGGTIASAALIRIHTDALAAADLASAYNIGILESGGAINELGVVRLGNIVVKA